MAMSRIASKTLKAKTQAEATQEELRLERDLAGRDFLIPLKAIPTAKELKVSNNAYERHIRYALGITVDEGLACPGCGHAKANSVHVHSCTKTSRATWFHNSMRDEWALCAQAAGLHASRGEPRSQPMSSHSGGADAKYTGLKVGNNGADKATLLVDVTYHMTQSPTNRKLVHGRGAGATAQFFEQEKDHKHEYINVAQLNGWNFTGAAMEKDTCQWGKGSKGLLSRFAKQREHEKFDSHGNLEYGFQEGLWNAPSFGSYWKQRVTIKAINLREQTQEEAESWAKRRQGTNGF